MSDDRLTIPMTPEDARELREILLHRPFDEAWSDRVLGAVAHALANGIDEPPPENPVFLIEARRESRV